MWLCLCWVRSTVPYRYLLSHLHKCGDALYRVKVIRVDSSGRALRSGCPHSGPECHGNSPALHGHSPCQPGQSLTLLGCHPGKVHWAKKKKKKKATCPWQLYSLACLDSYPMNWYSKAIYTLVPDTSVFLLWGLSRRATFFLFFFFPGHEHKMRESKL